MRRSHGKNEGAHLAAKVHLGWVEGVLGTGLLPKGSLGLGLVMSGSREPVCGNEGAKALLKRSRAPDAVALEQASIDSSTTWDEYSKVSRMLFAKKPVVIAAGRVEYPDQHAPDVEGSRESRDCGCSSSSPMNG